MLYRLFLRGKMPIYSNGVVGSLIFVEFLLGDPPSSQSWETCNKQNPIIPELMESGGKRHHSKTNRMHRVLKTKSPQSK